MDVLARRTRLAFLDSEAARQALPRVVKLMGACAEFLGVGSWFACWDGARVFLSNPRNRPTPHQFNFNTLCYAHTLTPSK